MAAAIESAIIGKGIDTALRFGNYMFKNRGERQMILGMDGNYKHNQYISPNNTGTFSSLFLSQFCKTTTQIMHNQQISDLKASCDHIENAIFYYHYNKLPQFQSSIEKSFDKAMDSRAHIQNNPNYLLGAYNNLIFTGFWHTAWNIHNDNKLMDIDCISGLHFIYNQLQRMNEEPLLTTNIQKLILSVSDKNKLENESYAEEKIFYENLCKFGNDTTEFVGNIQYIAQNNANKHMEQNEQLTDMDIDQLFNHMNYKYDHVDTNYLKQDSWCPNPDKQIYFSGKQFLLPQGESSPDFMWKKYTVTI
eukprot:303129_1